MSYTGQNFKDKVRYYLWHLENNERVDIITPKGWEDDQYIIQRDKKYFGIEFKAAEGLFFYQGSQTVEGKKLEGGYDFIIKVRNIGVNETLMIVKEVRNEDTNVYEVEDRMTLDLTSIKRESGKQGYKYLSINSADLGIMSKLKARKSEDIEITRRYAIDDENEENQLAEINTELVLLEGRKLQESGLQQIATNPTEQERNGINVNYGVPTDLKNTTLDSFTAVTSEDDTVAGSFYNRSESDSGFTSDNFSIKFDYDFEVTFVDFTLPEESPIFNFGIELVRWDNSDNRSVVQFFNTSISSSGQRVVGSYSTNIDTTFYKRLKLGWVVNSEYGTSQRKVTTRQFDITLDAVRVTPATTTKAYTVLNSFDRILEVITGRPSILKSDFFSEGIGQYFMITDGALVRNIPVTQAGSNDRTHQLSTSFKDLQEGLDATWNIGVGIEKEGFREYVRIEETKYFFNPTVVLELGQLTDIERTDASEYVYSGIDISYDGSQEIEGYQGLDKVAGKSNRITKITALENKYSKVSKIQSDDYVREVARIDQYKDDPTSDNKFDDTKMFLDCQKPWGTIEIDLNYSNISDLHEEGVVFDNNSFGEWLVCQFSTTPQAGYITTGSDYNELIENIKYYFKNESWWKDYVYVDNFRISLGQNTRVRFDIVTKIPFFWWLLELESNPAIVGHTINNYGSDPVDETYRQRPIEEDFDTSLYGSSRISIIDNSLLNDSSYVDIWLYTSQNGNILRRIEFTTGYSEGKCLIGINSEETALNLSKVISGLDLGNGFSYDTRVLKNTITVINKDSTGSSILDITNPSPASAFFITNNENYSFDPTGVFDVEGMTNGRWTTLAMTLRHGWWIGSGLVDYPTSKLNFGATDSNNLFTGTLKKSENEPYLKGIQYSEDSDINVSDLENPRFYPQWVKGKHTVSQQTMRILNGSSLINGKSIKNFYCLISWINEDGNRELGYCFYVKPKGAGEWKFLTLRKYV